MRFARVTTVIGIGIMTLGGVCLFVFAHQLISIFSTDPQVIEMGMKVLRIVAFAEPLFGASIVAGGALRGAGDSRGPFLISLGTMWGVRIVLSLLLAAPARACRRVDCHGGGTDRARNGFPDPSVHGALAAYRPSAHGEKGSLIHRSVKTVYKFVAGRAFCY